MAYTIDDFNKELKQKFGDRVTATEMYDVIYLAITAEERDQSLKLLPAVNIAKHLNKLSKPNASSECVYAVNPFDQSDTISHPIRLNGRTLKTVAKITIADIEAAYAEQGQLLQITRNQIKYELDIKEKKYAKAHGANSEKTRKYSAACRACLDAVDEGFKSGTDLDPQYLEKLDKKVCELVHQDHTAKLVGGAILALGLLLMVPAVALLWIGIGTPVMAVSTTAIVGGGALLGLGFVTSILGAEIISEESFVLMRTSKLGRLAKNHGVLFKQQANKREGNTVTPDSVVGATPTPGAALTPGQ